MLLTQTHVVPVYDAGILPQKIATTLEFLLGFPKYLVKDTVIVAVNLGST